MGEQITSIEQWEKRYFPRRVAEREEQQAIDEGRIADVFAKMLTTPPAEGKEATS